MHEALLVHDEDGDLIDLSEIEFLSVDKIKRLKIPENFPQLDDTYLDSTGRKYVLEKLEFLRQLGLNIPVIWATESAKQFDVASLDYISVINRMYIIAGYVRSWGIWAYQHHTGDINEEGFKQLIDQENALLRQHIDGVNGTVRWRERIDSSHASTYEGHVRFAGRRANIENKVSIDEMHQILEIFDTAFGGK